MAYLVLIIINDFQFFTFDKYVSFTAGMNEQSGLERGKCKAVKLVLVIPTIKQLYEADVNLFQFE